MLITAGAGNLVAIERAGIERKEFGSYLFGSVDVPNLEAHASPIEPYDASRSLQLNPAHPVSAALIAFIGSKLEEVRQRLVAESRELRRTEQARKLASEASKIAEILNKDFRQAQQRLDAIRSASVPGDAHALFGGSGDADSDSDAWAAGVREPGTVSTTSTSGRRTGGGTGRPAPNIPAAGERDPKGGESVDPAGGRGARKKPTGGFHVEFKSMGKDEKRSLYDPGALTILINLDHAVVSAALGDGVVEDVQFKRLAYEIAFSEYAMALGWEIARTDPDVPADELLYDIREILNRVSIAAAGLYRS
ncbi:MAG: hypothetical protein EXR93_05695 [Gemmatimonadetes bacterium]|nr:hypothetical protein [Gemmatimonadota bacterium]